MNQELSIVAPASGKQRGKLRAVLPPLSFLVLGIEWEGTLPLGYIPWPFFF